jgi:hypothetical protein
MTLSYLEPMTTGALFLSMPVSFLPHRIPENDEPSPRYRAPVEGPPDDAAIVNQAGAIILWNLGVDQPSGYWRNELRAQKLSSSIRCVSQQSPSARQCSWTFSKP